MGDRLLPQGRRLVIELPELPLDDLIAPCEILAQEQLLDWTLPVSAAHHLRGLLPLFGWRARIGVRGVRTIADVRAAQQLGASFLLSPVADPVLLLAAHVPLALGGLTPTEVHQAAAHGPAAVQVVPCEVLGHAYTRELPPMFPEVDLIPSGRLERFQVEAWLDAGARAVSLAGFATRSGFADLSEFRGLAQGWQSLAVRSR